MLDRQVTVSVTYRQLAIAVVLLTLTMLGLGVAYYVHSIQVAQRMLISNFQKSARTLRRELHENSTIRSNTEWQARYARAYRVLYSTSCDAEVVLFDLRVVEGAQGLTRVFIRYVDERATVVEIRYSPEDDGSDTGRPFLRSQDMPPKYVSMFGIIDLAIPIRPGAPDCDAGLPRHEVDGDQNYLVLDESVYADIVSQRGRLFLLDAKGHVCDSVGFGPFIRNDNDTEPEHTQ